MKSESSDGGSLMKMMSAVFARSERGAATPQEYFTPRLAHADRQLEALAARIGGNYRRGALDWSTFAARQAAANAPGDPADAALGRGSLVQKTIHGLKVEVTAHAQSLSTGERGLRWLVLAPRVTVTAGARASRLRLDRFDAGWSADEENATGADRLRLLLRARGAPSAVPPEPMPRAVTSARDRLIERVSTLACGPDHVVAVGRPLPRSAEDPREFGQASFEVEALSELIERARAFAHALATG